MGKLNGAAILIFYLHEEAVSWQLGRDKQTETWEMRRVAAKFIRMLYNPDGISTQSVKLFNWLLQPYVLNKL